ncbi:MAG: hypothetical protein K0R27_4183 [Xanthobacteraceae bacterium]|jgi:hypothetical protein|nr:hypothetical protein [Xanthobacteraceae bacterium]
MHEPAMAVKLMRLKVFLWNLSSLGDALPAIAALL